jgi:hypothetical protein
MTILLLEAQYYAKYSDIELDQSASPLSLVHFTGGSNITYYKTICYEQVTVVKALSLFFPSDVYALLYRA